MSDTQEVTTNGSPPTLNEEKAMSGNFLQSWKFKVGLIVTGIATILIGLSLLVFFWPHIIAGKGMKDWAKRAGATPIECMIKDTNDDSYVSCSAMLRNEVVPLECGSSIFNMGCRVNYGASAPPVRPLTLPNAGRAL